MSGLRIRHATERSCTFTLSDGSRPYREPWLCPPPPEGCARLHQFKTYHLRLDETGAVIVSAEIWGKLQRIPGQPFALANEVERPPAQRVIVPARLDIRAKSLAPGAHHGQ